MTRAQGLLAATLARLDLPILILLGDQPGVMLDAALAERDPSWHLARIEFAGGSLWIRDTGLAPGRRVRVGDSLLLARVTRRAVAELAIAPGQAVWVQVKSVALLD